AYHEQILVCTGINLAHIHCAGHGRSDRLRVRRDIAGDVRLIEPTPNHFEAIEIADGGEETEDESATRFAFHARCCRVLARNRFWFHERRPSARTPNAPFSQTPAFRAMPGATANRSIDALASDFVHLT